MAEAPTYDGILAELSAAWPLTWRLEVALYPTCRPPFGYWLARAEGQPITVIGWPWGQEEGGGQPLVICVADEWRGPRLRDGHAVRNSGATIADAVAAFRAELPRLAVTIGRTIATLGLATEGAETDGHRERLRDLSRRMLRIKMREYSEEGWCAGWLSGLDRDLYRIAHAGGGAYGFGSTMSREEADELLRLARDAGGWWVRPDPHEWEVFVEGWTPDEEVDRG